jgi:ABC-type oligopeptide transport system ATPase subunit
MGNTTPTLLDVRHLSREFHTRSRSVLRRSVQTLRAVDDVSFTLKQGETLGIVGESGSGKTTLVRCILRALDPTAGEALFHADDGVHDLARLSHRQLKPLRRQMQMIFQDPFSSLNPRMTVSQIVAEPLVIHRIGTRGQRLDQVVEMLDRVGLGREHLHRYPHAFSGGQRQRIGIARALIMRPRLVVADEAVSALDVSVQAQVLDLLIALQRDFGLTYIFVSHDLGVVRRICSRVAVMYRGRIMETADTESLFQNPRHAYTKVLLSAIPYPDPDRKLNPLHVADLSPSDLEPLPQ